MRSSAGRVPPGPERTCELCEQSRRRTSIGRCSAVCIAQGWAIRIWEVLVFRRAVLGCLLCLPTTAASVARAAELDVYQGFLRFLSRGSLKTARDLGNLIAAQALRPQDAAASVPGFSRMNELALTLRSRRVGTYAGDFGPGGPSDPEYKDWVVAGVAWNQTMESQYQAIQGKQVPQEQAVFQQLRPNDDYSLVRAAYNVSPLPDELKQFAIKADLFVKPGDPCPYLGRLWIIGRDLGQRQVHLSFNPYPFAGEARHLDDGGIYLNIGHANGKKTSTRLGHKPYVARGTAASP